MLFEYGFIVAVSYTHLIVKDDFGNVYGMFFALTGDGLSDRELSDYSELIKREVSELDLSLIHIFFYQLYQFIRQMKR